MAKSNFSNAFLPGLILGLVVGAFAGAFLSSLSLPAVQDTPKSNGAAKLSPVTPRDEGPKEEGGTSIDQGSAPKNVEGAVPKEGEATKKPDGGAESKSPAANPEVKPPTNDPVPGNNPPGTDPKLVK